MTNDLGDQAAGHLDPGGLVIEGAPSSPGFWLWHATLRWQRAIASVLAPLGLTHVQFVLLSCAWWMNDHGLVPNQLELARQAGTDVKMTSQVVRKLEAKGLLERETDPGDTESAPAARHPHRDRAGPGGDRARGTRGRSVFPAGDGRRPQHGKPRRPAPRAGGAGR